MQVVWTWTCPRDKFDGGALDEPMKLGFYGQCFGDPVVVNSYQQTTHFSDDGVTTDLCSVHVNNVRYLAGNTCSLNGGMAIEVSALRHEDATLKITLRGLGKIRTDRTRFWAYDGNNRVNKPVGVMVQCAEIGDKGWTRADGGSDKLMLAGHKEYAEEHSWYIALSVMPLSSGVKTAFAFAIETEYDAENGATGRLSNAFGEDAEGEI